MYTINSLRYLYVAVNPTLEEVLQRGLVGLECDLASGFVQVCVGLDKDSARLLLCQDGITDLGAPEVQADVGHVVVHVNTGLDIGSALVDVNLLQVLAHSYFYQHH